ncbi:MAG: sigma-54-dependent transcriptional regulator [Gemmatimonadota bacterium]
MADILIVDDESTLAGHYARHLAAAGHDVRQAGNGAAALRLFGERPPDVTLLDMRLPDMSGFEVLGELRMARAVVIMISGHADVPLAVRAVHEGALDFLAKPVELAQLGLAVDRALDTLQTRRLNRYLSERRTTAGRTRLGSSPRMRELTAQIELLAASDRTPVLILGEIGTGKAVVAELLHASGSRAAAPFVEFQCAALDESDLERNLFGPRAGGEPGLARVADRGTLFMQDIADLPAVLQLRLLRLIEGKQTGQPVETVPDVRILAASARDLVAEVAAGRFREDLYYRLSVMPLALPPLRERSREDVVELIGLLVDRLRPSLPAAPSALSDEALEVLLTYTWPGNVRELQNVLERALILSRGMDTVDAAVLPAEIRARGRVAGVGVGVGVGSRDGQSLEQVERDHIAQTLASWENNRTYAARALGISRATLIRKIREYGLQSGSRGQS